MTTLLSGPTPANITPLSPNGFMFSVQKIPEMTYFCQSVSIPSVSLGIVDVGTPFVDYPTPGDKLLFAELSVQFLVDSEMKNYRAIFDWINNVGFPESYTQYKTATNSPMALPQNAAVLSDATLTILGSNNEAIQTIQFVDCIPLSIESLQFSSTSTDVQYLVGNATFKYALYKFI
jgi:hypothetical protein